MKLRSCWSCDDPLVLDEDDGLLLHAAASITMPAVTASTPARRGQARPPHWWAPVVLCSWLAE
ncbi:MAG TPA: hypothetical protein VI365_35930 [Trebonia sp.]